MACNALVCANTSLPYLSLAHRQVRRRRRNVKVRMSSDSEDSSSILESVEKAEFSKQHPWDPHKPSFSPLLPKILRPYPSFEGWYTRIVDVSRQFSAGVIMATNYATQESQVTLLFSDSPHKTHAVAAKTKDANFSTLTDGSEESNGSEPQGFEWEATGLGKIVMKPHESELEVNLQGYYLRVEASHELPWDSHNTARGPEGWAGKIPLFPCHWYVYSLGSSAKYTFFSKDKNLVIHGDGFAHQEKNWGETFPAGHIWIQGLSADNSTQLTCAGARFKLGRQIETPMVFALGYRSQNQSIDLRSNDIGTVFKNLHVSPLEGKFSVTGIGPSHTVKMSCSASPESFSEQILAPIGKLEWKPACRESFVATIELEVYEHTAWGIANDPRLLETQIYRCAALEFGEDLLEAAIEQQNRSEGDTSS